MTDWCFEHPSHELLTPALDRVASLPVVEDVTLCHFRKHRHSQTPGSLRRIGHNVHAYTADGRYEVVIRMTEQTEASRGQVMEALSASK